MSSLPTGPLGCSTFAPASSTLVLALSGAPGGVTDGGLREQLAQSATQINSAECRMALPINECASS
ncbi:exported hypothetical protein [Xanthomonas citri pv. citri]|nr:exported hypothetical protein [Xanthomonas citri pv. citri]CEE26937.1 exported hypothetical protein [Xanthomonas citri pv. citri]CEE35541.1 exported hypothetical protein [Xanthomonas citri pv. citri]CEE38436.1 exported hypothetical protein [Xanthomonas citri pv. citri]CEE75661.1 exported hypothetical protein [Xanthomonas citri pv. citri]